MSAPQGESCCGMIESTPGSGRPSFRGVAGFAGFLKSPGMRVTMARRALGCPASGKGRRSTCLRGRVTLCTRNGAVPARQAKPGPIVAECRRGLPRVESVALLARGAEFSPVDIPVTTKTVAGESQECLRCEKRSIPPDVGGRPEFLSVASLAGQLCMLSPERKTHGSMIKRGPVEPHQREGTAVVFLMAFDTLAACQRTMQPAPGRHTGADLGMAGQAFLVRDGFPEFVAGSARAEAFQRCMGGTQFSRGDLCTERLGSQELHGRCADAEKEELVHQIHLYPNTTATPTWINRIMNMIVENGR